MTIASGAPAISARQPARVEPFVRAHPRVGGEARVELAVADVDRDHRTRAAREQHVGEAAGRGADVEAGEAVGIEAEGVERRGELDPAARGPGVRLARLDPRVLGERVGGFAHGLAVGADQPGGDRRLRAGAAGEESAFDENKIGALAHVGLRRKGRPLPAPRASGLASCAARLALTPAAPASGRGGPPLLPLREKAARSAG